MDIRLFDLFLGWLPPATLGGVLTAMRPMRPLFAGFLLFFLLPSLFLGLHRIRLIKLLSGVLLRQLLLKFNNPSLQLNNLSTQLDNDCCQLRVTRSFDSFPHETRCNKTAVST